MSCYLAIDQGTHASRAALFDDAGRVLATAYRTIDLENLGGGRVEQSPQAILLSVEQVVREVLAAAKQHHAVITACGIATQRSTLLACDGGGAPLSPALSWQDTRTADILARLKPRRCEITRLSGLPLSAHYGASKARWLLDHVRPTDGAPVRIVPLASYLLLHLLETRPFLIDHANAQRTQLLNIARLDWSQLLSAWFDVPLDRLPACRPILSDYGCLADSGIPVTAVSGDQNAALFGNGPLDDGAAHVNLGTGAFVLRPMDSPAPAGRLLTGIARSDADTATWLREGTVNGAGSALTWAAERLGLKDSFRSLPDWLDRIDDPPLFLNAVGGIGSPWWETRLQAGWRDDAGRDDAARMVAVVESILFLLADNLKPIRQERPVQRLRVTGGLSRLDGLCRRLADLTGLPVERIEQPEATARGVAWLCAGQPAHWSAHSAERFEPRDNPALRLRHERFNEMLSREQPG
jgi:glycerol kinase